MFLLSTFRHDFSTIRNETFCENFTSMDSLISQLQKFIPFDASQQSLWISIAAIAFNLTVWNIVARNEHRNRTLTRNVFGGNARIGCYFLAIMIFSFGMSRDSLQLFEEGPSPSNTDLHTRSRSAPPMQTTFSEPLPKPFSTAVAPDTATFELHQARRYTSSSTYTTSTKSSHSSPSSSFSSPYSWTGPGYGKSRNGDLLRPPPPLHRPTTFWRRTPRSGVTASSYSPASHLIRRSTFIAAGLPFEKPVADISALGVESRVKAQFDEDNARAKDSEVFWEVVVQR
ncbi:hypothetical protein DFH05DRAFT_1570409 [Lentinula detonsa]|uniref:Uncharacterized protein n=1 Tax=Lentinula detonsa TaxID=2804962 RepID=A0A9W8PCS2_9AGAR|nr:hypothetical protein DFH05DRAFT_1570409 [Lentinula detonsa]